MSDVEPELVWVDLEDDRGNSFTMHLPADDPRVAAAKERPAQTKVRSPKAGTGDVATK